MNRQFLFTVMLAAALMAVGRAAWAADPTTADCLAASDTSLKLGNQHKLRAERAQLLVCAAATCPADIRKECLRRVDEVNAQIPTVVFSARNRSGADLSAVRVTMDGEVLADRLEGTALSIDPGEHRFTFEVSGQPDVTKTFVIVEGQKDRREQIVFDPPATPVEKPPPNAEPVPPATPVPAGGTGTQKTLALVTGALGIAGVAIGATAGLIAIGKKNDAQATCPDECATQQGVNDWNDAKTVANISTVGFIVGGVGLAGAAALWFTAPSSGDEPKAQVGLGPGVVRVMGVW